MRQDVWLSRLRKVDWDFTGAYSESGFSSIHWHPARFVSQIAAALIGLLSKPGDLVLDPFVGSGTTCVEAQRLGRTSIGVDLNPVACLMARAKTLRASARDVEKSVVEIKQEAEGALSTQRTLGRQLDAVTVAPHAVQLDKWYSRSVGHDLGILWSLIGDFKGRERTIASAAFSSILLAVCRETRHWGYVCDNSTPKGEKEADVLKEFHRTLDTFAAAYGERDGDIAARGSAPGIAEAQIVTGDARDVLKMLSAGSVDLVVTSPPYFGVSDYVKAQRLSMEWFGYEIEPLRLKEIGARSKRHRRVAREEYLAELREVFRLVHRCLKRGAICCVVVGESETRDAVLKEARETLESAGLRLTADINRRVSSQRRQHPSITGEHIFIARR